MAEGGMAASLRNADSRDNWEIHFRDTIRGGKHLNNWRMVEIFCQEAPDRVADREVVDGLVSAFTLSMPRDGVIEACVAGEVPIAPVYSIADIFEDEQYKARETLVTVTDKKSGDITVPGVLPSLSETPGRIAHLGPALGEANSEIYGSELGFSDDELAALKKDGVI